MSLPGIGKDPGAGNADAIRGVAVFFRARADAENDRRSSTTSGLAALAPVTAKSVEALRPRMTVLADRFADVADAATDAAMILNEYATAVEDLQGRAARGLEQAQDEYAAIWTRRSQALNAASDLAVGWALSWDEVLPAWLYLDDTSYLVRWQAAIDDYGQSVGNYNALLAEREEIDKQTADRLRDIPLVAQISHAGVVGRAGMIAAAAMWAEDTDDVTAAQIAALGDSELVREVWDSLDRARRDALIEESPRVIGNLDGIPIGDRIIANRLNIADEIAAHEDEIERLEVRRQEKLETAGRGRSSVDDTYDALVAEEQRMIDYYDGLLTQKVAWTDESGAVREDTGARVVVFDPAQQAIATYHGPLDSATGDIPSWVRSVAISVPGTGSNVMNFSDARAADLYQAAGSTSAVFQWAGGEFPQSIPDAMNTSFSHDLAPRLRDFAAGVAVPANATLTVMGHSYGGAAVGLAEAAGLQADRVLYVAAAGMGEEVSSTQDFPNTSDVPHYAMMSRNDLVVGLIQGREGDVHALHGQSPLSSDSVTRLETGWIDGADLDSDNIEDYNVPGNGTPAAIDSHSSLYTPGSTSFNNMVAVITGGEVETFAESEIIIAGGRAITIDGIDRDDYSPTYVEVD
ncbi:alpha/beta hydrolase (plasmid) [Coraliomargarita sp. W4R53]